MPTIIQKSNIVKFLEFLIKQKPLFAPIKAGEDFVFGKIADSKQVELHPGLTILPPTKLLMPMAEEMMSFVKNETFIAPPDQPFIIFGVTSTDLSAISLLDQIMAKPEPDFFYLRRRAKATIIGLGQLTASSHSSATNQPPYDLFLIENNNRYFAQVGTQKGLKLIKNSFFEKTKDKLPPTVELKDPLLDDMAKIKKLVKVGESSKVFDKLAEKCLGCGICSFVCPLCYCFEQCDHTNLDTKSGFRCRHRDACMLPQFFAVANFDFKETLRKRYYNWYHHKFVRMPTEYQQVGCVNCGRCIEFCPVRINYREVLEELMKNEKLN